MKKLVIAMALVFCSTAHAQVTCRNNIFGTTCSNGATGSSTTYRDTQFGTMGSDGTMIRENIFGTTVTRPNGTTTTYRETPLGTFGSDGTTIRRDTFGTTITRPGGSTVRCRTDYFGNTTCQ